MINEAKLSEYLHPNVKQISLDTKQREVIEIALCGLKKYFSRSMIKIK